MGKISTYSFDNTPTVSDYVIGDSASGPNTQKFAISALVNTNVLTNGVKFFAYLAGALTTGTGGFFLMPIDTKVYDSGTNFNTTTHLFTAPVPGYYKFTAIWQCTGQAGLPKLTSLTKNSSITEFLRLAEIPNTTGNVTLGSTSPDILLAANDTIGFLGYSTEAKAVGVSTSTNFITYFSGELTEVA